MSTMREEVYHKLHPFLEVLVDIVCDNIENLEKDNDWISVKERLPNFHIEVKGNNIGLYCDNCGAWVKGLGKNELRAFNYAQSQKNSNDIIFTHEEVEKILEKPCVVLIDGNNEKLLINGESVCYHKRLYLSDVLDAL